MRVWEAAITLAGHAVSFAALCALVRAVPQLGETARERIRQRGEREREHIRSAAALRRYALHDEHRERLVEQRVPGGAAASSS